MEWMDKQMSELDSTRPMTTVFVERQVLYSAAMGECIRQVTLDCKERGILIRMLWDSSIELANSVV